MTLKTNLLLFTLEWTFAINISDKYLQTSDYRSISFLCSSTIFPSIHTHVQYI